MPAASPESPPALLTITIESIPARVAAVQQRVDPVVWVRQPRTALHGAVRIATPTRLNRCHGAVERR